MQRPFAAPKQTPRAAIEVQPTRRDVAPASVAAVMWEQIEYLMAHWGSDCPPECLDCKRLAEVKRCLLRPFE